MHRLLTFLALVCLLSACLAAAEPAAFEMHRVGTFRSEACGVGDFNNDGKLDIVAGPYLYLAPDWKPGKIRTLQGEVDEQGKGYLWDFMNVPLDVDGDGRLDVVSCSWFQMHIRWYRNPGPARRVWPETLIEENGNFECGDLVGHRRRRQSRARSCPASRPSGTRSARADGRWGRANHVVSEKPYDSASASATSTATGGPTSCGPAPGTRPRRSARQASGTSIRWRWAAARGKTEHTPQILVYDVNGDGLNDIITSSAHGYGIFWYEQVARRPVTWKQHLIDDSLDPGPRLTWPTSTATATRTWSPASGSWPTTAATPTSSIRWASTGTSRRARPGWTKHVISLDEGIGAGMNIPVVDLDGDGDLDIVVTGKWGGPVWFENKLTRRGNRPTGLGGGR